MIAAVAAELFPLMLTHDKHTRIIGVTIGFVVGLSIIYVSTNKS